MAWNEEHDTQAQRNWFSRLAWRLGLSGCDTANSTEEFDPPGSLEGEPDCLSGPVRTFAASAVWSEKSKDLLTPDRSNKAGIEDRPRMSSPAPQVAHLGSSMEQNRQRLAGHTVRIRLEPPPTSEPPSSMAKQAISETPRGILDASLPPALDRTETASPMAKQVISETPRGILDVPSLLAPSGKAEGDLHLPTRHPGVAKQEIVPSHIFRGSSMNKMVVGNQRCSPTGRMFKGNMRIVTRNPLCGSGEFICGRSDAVVRNPAIRASSVVVVTLTSNPGPVAIHYVSLLPYESFTVHLTAPTTMHTRFNYLIFSGELT